MKLHTLALAAALLLPVHAQAEENTEVVKAIEEYMEFSEYGSSIIFAEQIPAPEWPKIVVLDARDAEQYARNHIPGAVNIEWRQAIARRHDIPKDKLVVYYCNSGSLSAQAVFALRLIGWDNVKVLQGGIDEWTAKGGFEANARATKQN